jgi:hypothetical protein
VVAARVDMSVLVNWEGKMLMYGKYTMPLQYREGKAIYDW